MKINEMILTSNQAKLLHFISTYRWKYGTMPALQEMVDELAVADNRSVLRIIEALVKKGYIKRENKKTRTIVLTELAQEFLNSYLIPFQYRKQPTALDQSRQSSDLGRNDVSVSLPTSDFLGYKENTVKTDGTKLSGDIKTIVETAVSLAINKYFNGTQLIDQKSEEKITSSIGTVIVQIFQDKNISRNFGWGLLLVALTWAFNPIVENNLTAFVYSVVGIIIIKYFLIGKEL